MSISSKPILLLLLWWILSPAFAGQVDVKQSLEQQKHPEFLFEYISDSKLADLHRNAIFDNFSDDTLVFQFDDLLFTVMPYEAIEFYPVEPGQHQAICKKGDTVLFSTWIEYTFNEFKSALLFINLAQTPYDVVPFEYSTDPMNYRSQLKRISIPADSVFFSVPYDGMVTFLGYPQKIAQTSHSHKTVWHVFRSQQYWRYILDQLASETSDGLEDRKVAIYNASVRMINAIPKKVDLGTMDKAIRPGASKATYDQLKLFATTYQYGGNFYRAWKEYDTIFKKYYTPQIEYGGYRGSSKQTANASPDSLFKPIHFTGIYQLKDKFYKVYEGTFINGKQQGWHYFNNYDEYAPGFNPVQYCSNFMNYYVNGLVQMQIRGTFWQREEEKVIHVLGEYHPTITLDHKLWNLDGQLLYHGFVPDIDTTMLDVKNPPVLVEQFWNEDGQEIDKASYESMMRVLEFRKSMGQESWVGKFFVSLHFHTKSYLIGYAILVLFLWFISILNLRARGKHLVLFIIGVVLWVASIVIGYQLAEARYYYEMTVMGTHRVLMLFIPLNVGLLLLFFGLSFLGKKKGAKA